MKNFGGWLWGALDIRITPALDGSGFRSIQDLRIAERGRGVKAIIVS